jgi:hypothetical protein
MRIEIVVELFGRGALFVPTASVRWTAFGTLRTASKFARRLEFAWGLNVVASVDFRSTFVPALLIMAGFIAAGFFATASFAPRVFTTGLAAARLLAARFVTARFVAAGVRPPASRAAGFVPAGSLVA